MEKQTKPKPKFNIRSVRGFAVVLGIITLCVSVGAVVALAGLSNTYNGPMTGSGPTPSPSPTPTPTLSASFLVSGNSWTNGTAVNWGNLVLGANTKTISLTNTGNTVIQTVSITTSGLPSGWTLGLNIAGPIAVGGNANGVLTLTTDGGSPGAQAWAFTITVTS